jgi:hypothetical protein
MSDRALAQVKGGQVAEKAIEFRHLADEVLEAISQVSVLAVVVSPTDTLPSTHGILRVQSLSGVAINLTSTPTIDAGQYDGQRLLIIGQHDTGRITLQDESNLFGSALHLQHAQNAQLGKNDSITVQWDASQAIWLACSPPVDTY